MIARTALHNERTSDIGAADVRYPDPLPANVDDVLARIEDDALVLDVGGWWKPFNRANHVVDLLPFETRGGGGSIGPGPERFDASTWHQADICAGPLPFGENQFDFVYCGQTLEDIRDPIRLCAELSRVARAGYVEVPSMWIECCYDVDALPNSDLYPGYEKHRWIVQVNDGELLFIPKLSWMSLYRFVPSELFQAYRHRQELWTTPWHWEGEVRARELSFVGQAELVPFLAEGIAALNREIETSAT
ncbi:class I SAM-dependent methyltransferase [Frankia gtarii]|nr:class I SAM-dependent methyltransferase [Frankia gtarii]